MTKTLTTLGPEMSKTSLRRGFSLLLLERFHEMVRTLDALDQSPLEQSLWAAFLASGLDRYFEPQVEVYDDTGDYIVRVDFASTLLKIAVFTDGRKWHTGGEAEARDKLHNERLQKLGWLVKRYWTEAIFERLDATVDELYAETARRVWELQQNLPKRRS